MAIGIELGWTEADVRHVGIIALIQDFGMAQVPAEIRYSTDRLTEDEELRIQKHPMYTIDLIERIRDLPSMSKTVAHQIHERPNSSGYPRAIRGSAVHPFAGAIQVADAYIALVSQRPHRSPLMPYAAMECLLKNCYRGYLDSKGVRALLQIQSLFPIGSYVVLSDASIAQVLRRDGDHFTLPVVQRIEDGDGKPIEDEDIIDLEATELVIVQALATPGTNETALTDDVVNHIIQT